ncbi:reverse transcriptase domain-containing protein [Tanacetum coccineum]|uniref:Reverse transcriptase domain-containing protein n=1 Tax=Tanacetum coccineum TaxID=301880 RepID=A0ABQ5C931_9ASTR
MHALIFNHGNSNSSPTMSFNQIPNSGFPSIQKQSNPFQSESGNNFNQNRRKLISNPNRGSNFNQMEQVYQPPTIQTPVYQAPPQQMQGVLKTDFKNYVKANDAVLWNMQNQGQSLQNQMTNLTEMLSKFISSNTASSLNSGTLPSQTVTNPREHVNAITTMKVVKLVKGNFDPLFPTPALFYSSKGTRNKPGDVNGKVQKQVSENALIEMPKFNKWLSSLLRNKEKLEEITITTVNVECSAIILNKVPEKLEDPGKFLYSCALSRTDRTNALADFGASINRLPNYIYKQLGLEALKPTWNETRACYFKEALELVFYAEKSEKSKNKQFAHPISIIDFSKDEPFSGSTTIHSDALPPSSNSGKTSDNSEEFADELTLLKKGVHEENFQVYSNPLFEFDDDFNSSNVNPFFNEIDEDVENKNSNENRSFLAMEVSSNFEEGYFDSEGDVSFLENLLSDDTTHNITPEVIFGHEPKQNESIHNTSITFSPRNDPLHHEFAGELITLPSRIAREHEEYLSRMTLLCEISTSQSQENVHPSSIPVEDSDPVQEEIDIFLVPDDLIPPGIAHFFSEESRVRGCFVRLLELPSLCCCLYDNNAQTPSNTVKTGKLELGTGQIKVLLPIEGQKRTIHVSQKYTLVATNVIFKLSLAKTQEGMPHWIEGSTKEMAIYTCYTLKRSTSCLNHGLPTAPVLTVGHNAKKRKTSHSNWIGKATKGKSDHGFMRKAESKIAPTSNPKEAVCFYCNTKGHWKRSCPKYLKDLKDGKDLKESRRLKHKELNLVMGNRKITPVTRIGKYELMLKSRVRIYLNNCCYSSEMTRNIISFHALFKDGYKFSFNNENGDILVYPNGRFMFKASPCKGIHETIECISHNGNVILNVGLSNELDKSKLWHSRLAYYALPNSKRMECWNHSTSN